MKFPKGQSGNPGGRPKVLGEVQELARQHAPSAIAELARFDEVRQPIPAEPDQIERYDCEYKRNGTANLFVFRDAHRFWRRVKVTDSRTAVDFCACMRELVDIDFPEAERIRVVLDNQSTRTAGALYQAFPACEARRLLQRLEFHYVPKHASCELCLRKRYKL